jgi:uncharacterized protein YwqG
MSMATWIGIGIGVVILLRLFAYDRIEEKLRRRLDEGKPSCEGDWLRARVKELLEPSLLLAPGTLDHRSKLGGDPDLPFDVAWPSEAGSMLTFLAQIDLAQARVSDGPAWLPDEGSLFAFYDPEALDNPHGVRVLYSRESPGASSVVGSTSRFAERRVAFRRVISAPNRLWLGVEYHRVRDDNPGAWKEIIRAVDAPPNDTLQHRVGGYPNEIQDQQIPLLCEHIRQGSPPPPYQMELTPDLERAADTWRLLLQIDSDPVLGMNWGNGGRLYVFVRPEDARAADFSRTVSLWQTY